MERPLMPPLSDEDLHEHLRHYYGKVLQRTGDLEKKACCADDTRTRHAETLRLIPEEVKEKNYGCGSTLPEDDLDGLRVLDLGSGAGLDAFIAARLVGERGHVTGVDMTREQLDVARRSTPQVMRAFGHSRPNVTFLHGYIETCDGVEDGSIDLVISDCVINLSPRKGDVFRAAWRVLAEGGELHISDIVADRRVPDEIQSDATLVAECLGGALYEHDLLDLLREVGFADPRIVSRALVEEDVAGVPIRFFSVTLRAFKLAGPLDPRCEDYGQVACYLGTCRQKPARFRLDDHHEFEAGRWVPVCRNTARMLSQTRLARHFEVTPPGPHLGLFDCSGTDSASSGGAPCC